MQDVLRPIVKRVAAEMGVQVTIHSRCSGGGHGQVLQELGAFQRAVSKGQPGLSKGILVAGRDANCSGYQEMKRELGGVVEGGLFLGVAIACPDPHVERWLMADPESFSEVDGADPRPGKKKCEKDLYKEKLRAAVLRGGNPPTLGGVEFAEDLVAAMDLFRAGKNEPSLGSFVDDLKAAIGPLTV